MIVAQLRKEDKGLNENEQGWKRYYDPEVNKKATTKYRKKNLTQFNLVFHKERDWDIMCRLEAEGKLNKAKYIKNLIREDMKRTGFQAPPKPGALPDPRELPAEPMKTVTAEEIEAREKSEALKLLGL